MTKKLAEALGETRGDGFEEYIRELEAEAAKNPEKKARAVFMRLFPVALIEGLNEIAPDGEDDPEKHIALFDEAAYVAGFNLATNLLAAYESAPTDVRTAIANNLIMAFVSGIHQYLTRTQ